MSSNLINSKDIMPASQIIDFFNGNYMFYVENPYFDVKGMSKINKNNFLQYKEITNGVQLIEPKIYAKINGKYTTDFKIKLFSNCIPCRLFGPFSGNNEPIKPKANNKFMVNMGKPEQDNIEQRVMLLLNQQLCSALDFLMICRLIDIDIPENATDESFIKLVANKINFNDTDKLDQFIAKLNSKDVAIYEKSDMAEPVEIGLFDIMKDQIYAYTRNSELRDYMKKNVVCKFFQAKFKDVNSPLPALRITRSIGVNKTTNEEQFYDNVTGKLGFVLLLNGGKNSMFATKLIKNKQMFALEYDEYMSYVESKAKRDCNFIVSLSYDIRRYQSGSIAGTKLDVLQCIIKECKNIEEPILFDLDEDNDDTDEFKTTYE